MCDVPPVVPLSVRFATSVALAGVLLKAVAPPLVVGMLNPCAPAVPWVPSQANQVNVAVPDWLVVGRNRTRAPPGKSSAELDDTVAGTLCHAPPGSMYCQV